VNKARPCFQARCLGRWFTNQIALFDVDAGTLLVLSLRARRNPGEFLQRYPGDRSRSLRYSFRHPAPTVKTGVEVGAHLPHPAAQHADRELYRPAS
jgi:hypothetical protein